VYLKKKKMMEALPTLNVYVKKVALALLELSAKEVL
jgi:hypothetical protein